jgi:hypothetical protein
MWVSHTASNYIAVNNWNYILQEIIALQTFFSILNSTMLLFPVELWAMDWCPQIFHMTNISNLFDLIFSFI